MVVPVVVDFGQIADLDPEVGFDQIEADFGQIDLDLEASDPEGGIDFVLEGAVGKPVVDHHQLVDVRGQYLSLVVVRIRLEKIFGSKIFSLQK